MESNNPAVKRMEKMAMSYHQTAGDVMTVNGAILKTVVLSLLLLVTGSWIWQHAVVSGYEAVSPYMTMGLIGGFIFALITVFKMQWSAVTAPGYALCEGLALGGISALMEARYPGIVLQAVGLTVFTLFALLGLYRARIIQATEKFKMGVAAATGGVCLLYLITFVLGFFGVSVPYIHESGTIGIAFSGVVVVIAALNLILDFAVIEEGANGRLPKYMEWYAAFSLMVTLVWLYLEILRLLSKLRDRD